MTKLEALAAELRDAHERYGRILTFKKLSLRSAYSVAQIRYTYKNNIRKISELSGLQIEYVPRTRWRQAFIRVKNEFVSPPTELIEDLMLGS